MALFHTLRNTSSAQFKRTTGVSKHTFALMVDVVQPVLETRQSHGGPRYSLTIEDMVLMALTYWREYRTYFHLGQSYGLSESGCYKLITRIENILIEDTRFHIHGKKYLLKKPGTTVTIDVAESPIERPQKRGGKTPRNITILGKRRDTRSKLRWSYRRER
jgi:hypothetical protein